MMKTICVLNGKIVMAQDGDAFKTMEKNAAQYPGAVASVVSDAEYASLLAPTLDEIKAECLTVVDTAAARLDAKYLTVGGMQSAVYRIKEEQARAYKAAGYPVLPDPLANTDPAFLVYGHARQYRETLRLTNTTATDRAAADAIIAQADQMARLSISRERRLTFKQQIRNATTAAQAQASRDAALAELGAL